MNMDRTDPALLSIKETATNEIYTLSLHDALPISQPDPVSARGAGAGFARAGRGGENHAPLEAPPSPRDDGGASSGAGVSESEKQPPELQSRSEIVCRLLLVKKNVDARLHLDIQDA